MTYIFLGLLIFCAHLFNAWFSKRRIPDVLLLMLIGILVGPVSGWVKPEQLNDVGPIFASLTLLFILFDSGIDMRLDVVRRYWTGVVQVTFLSFVLSMATVTVIAFYLTDLELKACMLLGGMVAGTAAAIVIPLVRQMKVSDKTRVTLVLESAISGVLCIVISLAFIEGYKLGNVSIGSMLGRVFASILMSLIIGLVAGIVWSSFMERVRKLQNSMFLTPAFVFIIYGISEALGYSGAISALAFGLVLGNPEYFEMSFLKKLKLHDMTPLAGTEKSFFKEFVFILKTYFFVYIGICIPFTNTTALAYGAIIAAALFVVRFILVLIVGKNNTPVDRLTVSIMIPKGLVSAVLASVPEQVNNAAGYTVIPGAVTIKYVTYSIIFCSIIICSILVLFTSKQTVKGAEELTEGSGVLQGAEDILSGEEEKDPVPAESM
ncbi:MAG: cation:proton antiporter [Bacteroidales bacterium]|nr:cation:proton antiporter [Bacteroidales bacterium]